MSWGYLMAGVVIGAVLVSGAAVYGSMSPDDVNADTVCSERFGEEWEGERVDTDWEEGTAVVECTNGTQTERVGVEISAEVNP